MGTTKQLSRRIAPGVYPEASRWYFDELFDASEVGVLFDPSDLSTLFQDAAGTTPVTAPGQPVGLVLDKSKGLVLGSELVTNGTFGADTDWTKGTGWTISGGVATKTAGTASGLDQNISLVAGRTYLLQSEITRTAGTIQAQFIGGTTVSGISRNTSGTFSQYIVAVTGNVTVRFNADASFAGTIDNISVRELAGNHASQATSASRPIYGVVPKGGRRNLVSAGSDASFISGRTTLSSPVKTDGAGSNPIGTASDAVRFEVASGQTGFSLRFFGDNLVAGVNRAMSVYIKPLSGAVGTLRLGRPDRDTGGLNLATLTGNIATIAGNVGLFSDVQVLPDGWIRFSHSHTPDASGVEPRLVISGASPGNQYLIWGAQWENATRGTNYQRVGSSAQDITEAGAPTCHYLQFDGVDDWLSTAAINFTGTDKMSVFAGVRKLSDAAQGTLVELTNNSTNAGAFSLLVGNNTSTRRVAWSIASPQDFLGTADQAGVVSLIPSANLDRSGANAAASITPRINGLTPTSSEVVDGNATGNFANAILYLGRRGGTTLPYNGLLFGLTVRGVLSSTAEIRQTEKLLARRTSEVTLP
jgi:hypothetical protein